MLKQIKNKYFWFVSLLLFLPLISFAQTSDILGADRLLKEYLFPVSSYDPLGNPISKRGIECAGYKLLTEIDFINCDILPAADSALETKKWGGGGVYSSMKSAFRYKFTIREQGDYLFNISVFNDIDNFSKLTRQQIDYILEDLGYGLKEIVNEIGEGFSVSQNENLKYDLLRSLVFSVYLDKGPEDEGYEEAKNKKGFIVVKNNGSAIQDGQVLIGNLTPGEHYIDLHFLSDFYYNFSEKKIPDYLFDFGNADLNSDKILDINPVIDSVAIDGIIPVEDIIGIRIYSNNNHKYAKTWYKENVLYASPEIEDITVDGYQAVRDGRTVYVNAANLSQGVFYTNIYVIAYNEGAAAATENIFNQMLSNWIFNKNLIDIDPLRAEEIKDKLRRDTIRLADLNFIDSLIQRFYQTKGKYPTLEAGTFVRDHTISTWPSWQANLGKQLGSVLPVDPKNLMITKEKGQYNCQSILAEERNKCQNICSRDSAGNPLTGCPVNQQCIDNQYCSICPPGFDPTTCWDNINLKFAFGTHTNCPESAKLNGSFNLGGTNCQYDGAYVYQYTSVNEGKAYLLNYRLEYTEPKCPAGQCYFNNGDDNPDNDCYPPGSCLYEGVQLDQNRNVYCYLGAWRNSCGDGYLQQQCGEECDPSVPIKKERSWCDSVYGDQDWYNEANIKTTCGLPNTALACRWQSFGTITYTPQAYTPQTDDIDCGGYCGDRVIQTIYGEQCDEGKAEPTLLKSAELGGLGGKSREFQYMCSGTKSGKPIIFNGNQCDQFVEWDINTSNYSSTVKSCGADLIETGWVRKFKDNSIVSDGGFKISFKFDVVADGTYIFKLKTANYDDDFSKLTDEQIRFLFFLKKTGFANLHNLTTDDKLVLPEYGEVTNEQRNNLLKSLVYSVYLDGEDITNRVGYLIASATNQLLPQEEDISIGFIKKGEHTIILHFIGDHLYLPLNEVTDLQKPDFSNIETGETLDNVLDINPIIYSVTLFSPEISVGNCKTFGGWCGDGIVQTEFGEQCDIASYRAPLPQETVNLINGYHPTYKCGEVKGKLCQYQYYEDNTESGYCGDGIVQTNFGETCDDRVGASCISDNECGKNGKCLNNVCISPNCNSLCSGTYCGDGVVQRPNQNGVFEVCDWANPNQSWCDFDCQHIKISGLCNSDLYTTTCDPNSDINCLICRPNLSCTIRNFGDLETKCLGVRGSFGCRDNNDCSFGYYCNLNNSQCEPEIATYLKYHPQNVTFLPVPQPDLNISKCPDLQVVLGTESVQYILDKCTNLNWAVSDNITRKNWTYNEALSLACKGNTRLPTILELYSLVRQTNQYLGPDFYGEKEILKLCPLKCDYAPSEEDLCSDCQDDNYLYWSSSCVERERDICKKALALNFKYGSIETYPTIDNISTPNFNEESRFKVHCLRQTECGNGILEEGEVCEFYKDANNNFVEHLITKKCTEFGYDNGFVHCDPRTCNFRLDNCYLNSVLNETCQETCQKRKKLDCQSVGTNINDYLIINSDLTLTAKIADNSSLLTKVPETGICLYAIADCNYRFVEQGGDNCRFEATNVLAPFKSEFSYCNCKEKY